jgi:hypothetical protein
LEDFIRICGNDKQQQQSGDEGNAVAFSEALLHKQEL